MDATTIVDGLRQRSTEALGAFYDDCGGILYGLILRIVENSGAAEIIFELTFGEIWNHSYKEVQTDGELRILSLLLGRRNAIEYKQLQANGPTRKIEHVYAPPAVCPVVCTVDKRGRVTPNIVDCMNAVMNRLSAEDRELFDAVYFSGRRLSQIALRTGVPREELARRIAQIFKLLRGATENNRNKAYRPERGCCVAAASSRSDPSQYLPRAASS